MTGTASFCFVAVFAGRPLTGNPLPLVIDAHHLPEPQMQAIAREFNQSETTFLLRPSVPALPAGCARSPRSGPKSSVPGTTRSEPGCGSARALRVGLDADG